MGNIGQYLVVRWKSSFVGVTMTTTTELIIKQCNALRAHGHQDAFAGIWEAYPVVRLGKVMMVSWKMLTRREGAEIEDAYSRWAGVEPAWQRRQKQREKKAHDGFVMRQLAKMSDRQLDDLLASVEAQAKEAGVWEPPGDPADEP